MLLNEIEKLVNEEVERRMMSRLTNYAESISVVHGIPLRLLLRDIPKDDSANNMCKGLLKTGKRCSRRSKTDGFCLLHLHQKKSAEPIQIVSEVVHNHSFPPLFKQDCPACKKVTSAEPSKLPSFLSTF